MKRLFLLFMITLPLAACWTTAEAQDSVEVRGYWQRFVKNPRRIPVDTAWENKEARRDAKKLRFIYNVDFESYFDNREYWDRAPFGPQRDGEHRIQMPQTIFSFRLSPTVGLRINDRLGGSHKLIAGVRYTQPLGGNWSDAKVAPTAYYHFSNFGLNLQLGAIPYENRIMPMPDWLQYDSLVYARPNIQGALFTYQDHRGYVEFMCDWRGSQTRERREMFRVLINGQYQYKWFFVGGLAHLNHTAGTANPETQEEESLYDDMNLSAHIGFDFTQLTPFDSLALKVSYIYGRQRDRGKDKQSDNHGMLIELYANWWFLGLKNTTYIGNNLQPMRYQDNLGTPIGSLMCQGDPFYQATFYNRTDIFAYIYRSSYVNCYMSWNMHYDNVCKRLQHQQQLIVRFSLDGLRKDKTGSLLRGMFDK